MRDRSALGLLGGILFCACVAVLPGRSQAPAARANWHEDAFFGIHYDFHASAKHTEIGKELTPGHLRERLLKVRPDWIHTDCKGVYGYTSWPTRIGSTAPGLVKDTLRIYRDVTRELGMKLGVHYCALWDERAIELHPEWARVDAKGQRDRQYICLTSGYDEQLMIPQMLEIIDTYDVDGFWIDADSWGARPCWCDPCKAEFTRRTGIRNVPTERGRPNWDEWLAFHRDLYLAHVTKYTNAIHARKPGCMVTVAWMYGAMQPDPVKVPVDHLSGDVGDLLSTTLEARAFDGRGLTWDLMPWGFVLASSTEDNPPNTYKSALQLKQEVARIVALGGAVMIYEQPQISGLLTGWHHEVLAEVAEFARARKEACFKSETVPQAAVLHLADHYFAQLDTVYNDFTSPGALQPVKGALYALLEAHRSTDVLTEEVALRRMKEYKLVVVPEQTHLSERLVQALEEFARSGGYVLISGEHLSRDYPRLVAASPRGELLKTPIYLPVGRGAVGVSAPWQPATPAPGTEALTYRLNEQDPEKNPTDQAVATKRVVGLGAIVAIHGPIFRDYWLGHYPLLREFIAGLIEDLAIPWKVTVEGPPRLELVVRQKEGRLHVNLINRGGIEVLSANRAIVEDLPPLENVTVRIRQGRQPKSVSVIPNDMKIDWAYSDSLVTVKVPRVGIHCVLVVE